MKKTKGISLIVLVITIIVMIIIAGAIMLTLTNTNVIDQAEMAAEKHNLSQIKEAIKLEKTNALFARYDTAENVNISVKELLGLTDSDAMMITSTNTLPSNMPDGKYYKLDVTKYDMKNVGVVENNIIKGVYVINDNYDIYYIVEGTIDEVAQEIDDEKVVEILTSVFMGGGDEETIFAKLKQELHIEKGNNINDIAYVFYEPIGREIFCYYFYSIDRMYFVEYKEVDGEEIFVVKYADKEDNNITYKYAQKLEQIRKELTYVFVGKSLEEIKSKYDNGTLKSYVLERCSNLKDIELTSYIWQIDNSLEFRVRSIVFEYGNNIEEEFCEYNTIYLEMDENGIYYDVLIQAGT